MGQAKQRGTFEERFNHRKHIQGRLDQMFLTNKLSLIQYVASSLERYHDPVNFTIIPYDKLVNKDETQTNS